MLKNVVSIIGIIREIYQGQKDGLGTEIFCRKETQKAQKGTMGTGKRGTEADGRGFEQEQTERTERGGILDFRFAIFEWGSGRIG